MNDQIDLERLRYAAQTIVDKELLHPQNARVEVSDTIEFTTNRLVLQLQAEVLGRRLGRMVSKAPATWWDHLKQDRFLGSRVGRWYVRRHPVRFTYEVHSAYATFPEARIVYPKELGRPYFSLIPELADRPWL